MADQQTRRICDVTTASPSAELPRAETGAHEPQGQDSRVSGPTRLKIDNMQMLLAAELDGGGIVYGPTFVLGGHIAAGVLEQVFQTSLRRASEFMRFIRVRECWLRSCAAFSTYLKKGLDVKAADAAISNLDAQIELQQSVIGQAKAKGGERMPWQISHSTSHQAPHKNYHHKSGAFGDKFQGGL